MKISERLLIRLQKINPALDSIERVYTGYHQRSAGAWSWRAWSSKTPTMELGSQQSMYFMLKANEDEFNNWLD